MLSFGYKVGWSRENALEKYPQINIIPFEPERRYSASFHENKDSENQDRDREEVLVFVKGAPEKVLSMCDLSFEEKNRLEKIAIERAKEGYRVLALAEVKITSELDRKEQELPKEPSGLDFLGFVGMIDPL